MNSLSRAYGHSLVDIMVEAYEDSLLIASVFSRSKNPGSSLRDWRSGKGKGPEKHRRVARQR